MKNIYLNQTVLAIFAHPDDAEFLCAGTLSLLKKAGFEIHIATFTSGDKGTIQHSPEEISHIRKAEAASAAGIIGAGYQCLGFDDVFILYNRETIEKATSLIRTIKPFLVFTHSPTDYMIDHEMASLITQTACFAAGMKNLQLNEEAFETIPYLYYSDPMEGKNKFGEPVHPSVYIDISHEIEVKEDMLACHASQRNWLLVHHKMDEYLQSMKRFAHKRGIEAGVSYAEGFRQHLGHGFPQQNIIKELLFQYVR